MRDRLEIQTLGGLFITLGGESVTGFDSRKVSALLVYLACTERAYPREVLAEFFWEGRTQSQALKNLRVMLTSLRQTVAPYVIIPPRQSASMNLDSGYLLDINEFSHRLDVARRLITDNGFILDESAEQLEAALELYAGDFLVGFYDISEAFDDWARRTREGLWGEVIYVLDQLVHYYIGQKDYRAGLKHARRLEEMDNYNETAHRHLMLLHAMLGQRHAAIEQYEKCCQLLADELDVEPSAETQNLIEQIRADDLHTPAPAIISTPQPTNERYQITEAMGQGSLGDIYRGIDTVTQQAVMIKVLEADSVENPETVSRFKREGETLEALAHQNIVKLLDVVETPTAYQIVTEYVGGESLADLLQRESRLPLERVLRIALDVSDALTQAHRHQIVHRNIKPENILLGEDGRAKLSDFGLARIETSSLTASGSVIGTFEYLSPEALDGDQVDARADIWSFGVMLYEMLTGHRPFEGRNIGEIIEAVINQPTPDLEADCPEAPIALVDLIYRMLDKNQQVRIRSVRQVGLELEAILDTEDIKIVRPEQAHEDLASWKRKSSFDLQPVLIYTQEHNLPETLMPLVGRDLELETIKDLLDDPDIRLVTIVGPGGVGKTQLSITAAREQINDFEHGVFLVRLSSLRAAENIVAAVAEAVQFEFHEGEDAQEQLLAYLGGKAMLLVMDNFEHLLDGAGLISEVLKRAPSIKLLVTSQEKLNIQGEATFPITGIPFPHNGAGTVDIADYPAVDLFVQSARRAVHHFQAVGNDWEYIKRICQAVEGLPLGILLAAAWIEMLSVEEIAAEIEQGLEFLETQKSDVPQRQRSVRAVFDYAWELMRADEQDVFMKMSVFRGGFTRQAVQAIIPDASLRMLMGLVNKSLLYRDPDSGRYDMHGLSRQFAAEKLQALPDEPSRILEAHCKYFADFVGKHESEIRAGLQSDVLQEIENVRKSWTYAVERQQISIIRQFIESLSWLYEVQGWYQEGLDQFRYAVEVLGQGDSREHQVVYGWLVGIKGWFMARCGDRDTGQVLLKESIEQLRELDAREELALTQRFLGRLAESDEELREALEGCEAAMAYLGDSNPSRIVSMHIVIADLAKRHGNIVLANKHIAQGEEINMQLDNPRGEAEVDRVRAELEAAEGNSNAATRQFLKSLATYQELGYRHGVVYALKGLGRVANEDGNRGAAIQYYLEALEISVELNLQPSITEILIALIPLHFAPQGDEKVVEILAFMSTHLKPNIEGKTTIESALVDYRDTLADNVFDGAYQRGRQLSIDQIIDDIRDRD